MSYCAISLPPAIASSIPSLVKGTSTQPVNNALETSIGRDASKLTDSTADESSEKEIHPKIDICELVDV